MEEAINNNNSEKSQENIEINFSANKPKKNRAGKSVYAILRDRMVEQLMERKTVQQMADEFEIPYNQMMKLRAKLLREVGELTDNRINQLRREFFVTTIEESEKLANIILEETNGENGKIRLDAVRTWAQFIKTKMEFLERFKIIEPISKKQILEGDSLKGLLQSEEALFNKLPDEIKDEIIKKT